MTKNTIRIISADDIRKALPMRNAIEAMKEAFIQISRNPAILTSRIHLSIPEHNGDSLVMPIYMPSNKKIGLKFITLFDKNPKQGLPLIHALVTIFDATNGRPLALMDGSYLTALRTGAGSGLATKLLARKNSKKAAIFGAGIQGRTQLEAICSVRPIKEAIVFDRDVKRAKNYVSKMRSKLDIKINVANSSLELLEADIICTATSSRTPVFSEQKLKTGVHINAIGSYKPDVREIPSEIVSKAKIIVDHKESALSEAGDLIIPLQEGVITEEHIYAELGEIVSKIKKGRESNKEITLFKSVGNAIQDLVAANQILLETQKLNLGTEVNL
jgi:ornithine cyclodeaminase/alanine dehydrogenase-like protein (mu-crystallin family)